MIADAIEDLGSVSNFGQVVGVNMSESNSGHARSTSSAFDLMASVTRQSFHEDTAAVLDVSPNRAQLFDVPTKRASW